MGTAPGNLNVGNLDTWGYDGRENQKPDYEGRPAPLLVQYWNAVWRHRLVIGIIIVACTIGGGVLTALASPKYTAQTTIEISREQDRVTNVDGLQSDRAGQTQEFYSTQYELLEARSLGERVARELGLARSSQFFDAHDFTPEGAEATQENYTGMTAAQLAAREKAAVNLLMANIEITPVRGSALVIIGYTSFDPEISAQIANAWSEEFIASGLDRRFASTADAREFLEGRLADLRQRLNESERELVQYARNENIITLQSGEEGSSASQTLTGANLAALNERLSEATAARISAEADVQALRNQRENPQMVDSPSLNALSQQRASLQAELGALLVRFEPQYPPAQALQEQIDSINRAIELERSRVARATNAILDSARQRESNLREQVNDLVVSFQEEGRNGIQFGILQREVDTNRELYEGLLQRFKEIGVAGVGANNISIVDRALPPVFPSSPNLALNILLSMLVGIVLAGGVVVILENLDQGLRDPAAIPGVLGVPLLGVVPDSEDTDARLALNDRKSAVSEAYSTIQTNLSFSSEQGIPQAIMLTSTQPAEGKSTSAFALAQGIARMGRSVVLVDADMRKPTLARFLGQKDKRGLSNYLAGDNELEGMLIETEWPGLTALTSGPIPPSAPELLGSGRLDRLTSQLKSRFDVIIFDSPPMLGLADALQISRAVEGVVYIAESERGSSRAIKHAIQRIKKSHTRVLGLILTKYSSNRSGYGYGYSYSYYQYGSHQTVEGSDLETAGVQNR